MSIVTPKGSERKYEPYPEYKLFGCRVAGDPGLEPGLTDPESVVLPLD